MTSQTLKQKISEVKKGCGYFAGTFYNRNGKTTDYACGEIQIKPDGWGEDKLWLCSICQATLSALQEAQNIFIEMIDDVDIELMFTDIKDKEGNKAELSDEIMEVIRLWWEKKSEELKEGVK